MSKGVVAVALVSVLGCAAQAANEIKIERWNGTSWDQIDTKDNGASFTFNPADDKVYRIYTGNPNSHNIGQINIGGSTDIECTIFIGEASSPASFSKTTSIPPGAYDLGGFIANEYGPKVHLQVTLNHDSTGDIIAYDMGAVEIVGDLEGLLTHNPQEDAIDDMGRVQVGRVIATGEIRARGGDIPEILVLGAMNGNIRCVNGDLGDVTVLGSANYIFAGDNIGAPTAHTDIKTNGGVATIECDNLYANITPNVGQSGGSIGSITIWDEDEDEPGDIGTPANPVTITAADGIGVINCDGLYADITANQGGTGTIDQIFTWFGSFEGSLSCDGITDANKYGIDIAGALEATVDIDGDVNARISVGDLLDADMTITGDVNENIAAHEGLPEDRTLWIGGSLASETDLAFGNDSYQTGGVGLAGQVVINGNDDDSAWYGTVTILDGDEDIVLSDPDYDDQELYLGGGAAGEAPYMLHGYDCVPRNGATISAVLLQAKVRHYGPIDYTSTPVTVSRRPVSAEWGSGFTDMTGSFSFAVSGTNPRDLIVTPNSGQFDNNYEYKIEPTSALVCVDVDGTPQVSDYDYTFTLFSMFDLSQNAAVDTPDVTQWLIEPVDFNNDEVADSTDLGMLVSAIGT